jgi:O-antigen ligase
MPIWCEQSNREIRNYPSMPEHLRALVVILVLASLAFATAKGPACALASTSFDFERRRNLWFGITLVAFLALNFWVYIILAAVLLIVALPREPNKLALFYFLLFAVPAIPADIPGMGIVNYFFTIEYVRMLILAILLPAFLSLQKEPDVERFGRSIPDKLIAGYLVLNFLLLLPDETFTNSLRLGVFYPFLGIFLPYYVASRSVKNLKGFRDVLMAFVIASLVLSLIGIFEFAKHWLLYYSLGDALGHNWNLALYLPRGVNLRAQGSVGQPIPFGYVMAVATGLFLYLRKSISNSKVWGFGLLLLILGLIAPLSRGPWLGAAVILLVFIATGPSGVPQIAKLALLGVILTPALLASPVGPTIVAHLPFVGNIEAENVTYRQRLLEIFLQIIMQKPLFGASNFMNLPAMQELKFGNGLIDVLNSYLGVALESGLVGLSLFSGFFVAVALGIFKSMRNLADRNDESYRLGQALFSTLLGIMVIIFTVSSISVIPVIYWSVAGLGVAYSRMLALARTPQAPQPTGLQPTPIKTGSYLQYRK